MCNYVTLEYYVDIYIYIFVYEVNKLKYIIIANYRFITNTELFYTYIIGYQII